NDDGSRFFFFFTKLFEYMGVRKPIIASDLEQISEVISPSISFKDLEDAIQIKDEVGILCSQGNAEELSAAILAVAKNLPIFERLGTNARAKARRQYTWDIHVSQIIKGIKPFYKKVNKAPGAFNIGQFRNIRYYQVGPLPPPYGGVSIFVKRYSHRLAKRFLLQPIDTRRLTPQVLLSLFLSVVFYRKPFILHLNSINIMALSLLKLRVFPYYLRLQDHSERNLESYGRLKRFYLSFLLKRVDELVLVGPHIEKYYSTHGIRLPQKIRVRTPFIPPPLNEENQILSSYPESLMQFLENHQPVVIMNAYKIIFYNGVDLYGFDQSIDLLYRLKELYPKVGMIFALADDSDKDELKRILRHIHELNLTENSYFLTNQKQIWPLFKRVDLMIRPTAQDGYGISVAEAIHFGCPTLASNTCVRSKGTILFKTRDTDDLYEKALLCLNQRQKLKFGNLKFYEE
ncbi:MAG: glycosyltransferase, partial [Bdellovibrionales bacterium]|nr:glycosyltransferase [Bdellovibrionales bacterium]